MEWIYKGKPVPNTVPQFFGFVYCIHYDDETLYIGKKRFFQTETKQPLKSGANRVGGKFFNKIINRKVTKMESVTTESDWRTYEGSSKKTKHLKIVKKEILQLYQDSINLSLGELEFQIRLDTIRNEMYHNDNYLGKFFRGKILPEIK